MPPDPSDRSVVVMLEVVSLPERPRMARDRRVGIDPCGCNQMAGRVLCAHVVSQAKASLNLASIACSASLSKRLSCIRALIPAIHSAR